MWSMAANWTLGHRIERLQKNVASNDQLAAMLETGRNAFAAIKAKREVIDARHDALYRIVSPADWGELMKQIADAGGEGVWFRQCRIDKIEQSTGRNQNGQSKEKFARLEITGYALSNAELSRFLARLANCKRVTDVEPNDARQEKVGEGHLVAFTTSCAIRPPEAEHTTSVKLDANMNEIATPVGDALAMGVTR